MTEQTTTDTQDDDWTDGLTVAERTIVQALAIGRPYSEAAAAAGVSESTVGRRMQVPEFRAAVETERTRRTAVLADTLSAMLPRAILTLDRLMREGSEGVQLRSAVAILDQGLRYREAAFVTERLAAVEDQLARRPRR